ncbi:cell wall protein DAN4-like [Contarinia nasturtii]|uniref:cell wall protein DAN4-like n=1 Tax=Contarinia nasturtii TaxID=265458 RepID=UPI0012D4096C|nr:cell wall protein DAN4-like [Contarinia nasturtii]XP_031623028.1 cell wall protein DAN4-like [Contarinia nasturtii]XP_031623036.1 cell wall protein DAN4-like [Contarinia nasturtii]XP_031623043.1 cell wall protein DAN4-like [Contarinia nasturtii]XP_031623051.1 cell wall protein DAN4-like [Contarinia nasturtii]XP_031623059.1 cell wall protein DAN4-like [Contarinia nasturtii]
MKAFALLLCMYMMSLVYGLPIISKPLENNPDHLVWEALLTSDTHRSDDKSRKIPKSIFITPNLNESKGNCPPDHKLGPDGRCYKTLQIDPLVMLKKQIESLLKNNSTATTEYDDDYDYSEYGESTESMNSNGQYTVPLSLGFSSENRIPQQHRTQHTTFSNLNRIVKDDAHVPSVTSTHTDSREKQPFRVSTTGVDLGSDEVIVEPKPEPIASVATTSSAISSNTVTDPIETSSQPTSTQISDILQNSNSSESTMATTIPTINSGSVDDDTSSSTNENISSTSTEISDASSTVASSAKMNEEIISSTEKLENQTSSENFEKDQDVTVALPLKSTLKHVDATENISTTSSTLKNFEPTSTTEFNIERQSSVADTISSESSTASTIDQFETQNESSELKLTVLPQADEAKEKVTIEIDETTEKQPSLLQSTEKLPPPLTEGTVNQTEEIVEKVDAVVPSVVSMNLKLAPEQTTERLINSTESQTTESSSSTTAKVEIVDDKNDSYEVIDAYFIPSELPEEIDPIVGKNATVESRYRLENTSVNNGDEMVEAVLAPVINTGIDGRSNIELVKSTATADDDKNNFTARLIEELLFEEPSTTIELPNKDVLPNKSAQNFNKRNTSEINETVQLQNDSMITSSESIENDEDSKKMRNVEEALSGSSIGGGFNVGSDLTTEQTIDYDSREVKVQTETIKPAIIETIDYEGELPSKEALPFKRLPNLFQLSPPSSSAPPPIRPSIYSTFISRLKIAPPFVELHDHHPEKVQYSHTPFDITSTFQNTNRPNARFLASSTHPTYTLPGESDHSYEDVEQPTPVRAKSLPLGINCYMKNSDKQQYIICDDA